MPSADEHQIARAVKALKEGLLVAFPTETVYGLGADAGSAEAIARLYKVKGRPQNHPVIVHLGSIEQLKDWASSVPEAASRLASQFWPGPLTLILPKAPHVLAAVTGGQDTVGLRIPRHPLALALLAEFKGGIAAPSANKFGRLSPTTAADVESELGDEVACVLDGGPCEVGIESTIVDFSQGRPRILRPGMILAEQIEAVLGLGPLERGVAKENAEAKVPQVPGSLTHHYAPATPLKLLPASEISSQASHLIKSGARVCALLINPQSLPGVATITASSDAACYAQELYSNLRKLDDKRAHWIIVEQVPAGQNWIAVADRLTRAAAGSGPSQDR
jgi:L-threonylcarbamoyladenylate synthase